MCSRGGMFSEVERCVYRGICSTVVDVMCSGGAFSEMKGCLVQSVTKCTCILIIGRSSKSVVIAVFYSVNLNTWE